MSKEQFDALGLKQGDIITIFLKNGEVLHNQVLSRESIYSNPPKVKYDGSSLTPEIPPCVLVESNLPSNLNTPIFLSDILSIIKAS